MEGPALASLLRLWGEADPMRVTPPEVEGSSISHSANAFGDLRVRQERCRVSGDRPPSRSLSVQWGDGDVNQSAVVRASRC